MQKTMVFSSKKCVLGGLEAIPPQRYEHWQKKLSFFTRGVKVRSRIATLLNVILGFCTTSHAKHLLLFVHVKAGGSLELDFNSQGGGTVKKTKDHELGVREKAKSCEHQCRSEGFPNGAFVSCA